MIIHSSQDLWRNNRVAQTRRNLSLGRHIPRRKPRCSWRSENDYDLNGTVLDPRSGRSTRILLGDGKDRARTDKLGRIRVFYFDEGILGNFGWEPPGPAPIGSAGLLCFSDIGEKIWEYPQEASETISYSYALNVSGSEAAIFFYTDFPICRISSDFRLEYLKTDLRGRHQLAISETKALLSSSAILKFESYYAALSSL
jgi:hypothetical protein